MRSDDSFRLAPFGAATSTFSTGFVSARRAAAHPRAECDSLGGNASDIWLLRPSQIPTLNQQLMSRWGLQNSPLQRVGKDDRRHWRLAEKLSLGLSPQLESRLRAQTCPRLGLDGASLWGQNQLHPSESQKKKRKEKAHNPSATSGSPHHIFYVVPAFNVSYQRKFTPLTPRGKWDEWLESTWDPRGFALYAFESATLEYSSSDGFCGYGKGWGGYGECYGSVEADANISSFLGDYLFPVLMHQDPRYFRLGEGGFGKRVWHAISHVFVTYNDSGHTVFYTSALSGTFIAAGISNLYYPSQDVGFSKTISRAALDLGNTALFNLAAEFWPDIHRNLHF